jgi:hypothetical protein
MKWFIIGFTLMAILASLFFIWLTIPGNKESAEYGTDRLIDFHDNLI